jgi:hypothetical protein
VFALQLSESKIGAVREEFSSQPLPSILLSNVLPAAWASQLRARLAGIEWQSFFLAHRGKYLFNDSFQSPALFDEIKACTQKISSQKILLQRFRWLQLKHGDYSLLRDDTLSAGTLDVSLEFSEASIPNAELCYCYGRQVYFAVPSQPLSLSIVYRGATVLRFQRYLNHQTKDATLLRLQLSFVAIA